MLKPDLEGQKEIKSHENETEIRKACIKILYLFIKIKMCIR